MRFGIHFGGAPCKLPYEKMSLYLPSVFVLIDKIKSSTLFKNNAGLKSTHDDGNLLLFTWNVGSNFYAMEDSKHVGLCLPLRG